jgi:hypothetical protein
LRVVVEVVFITAEVVELADYAQRSPQLAEVEV